MHGLREYVMCNMINSECNKTIVKVDIRNAFNSVRRDIVLEQVLAKCPEMFPMLRQAFSAETPLFTGTEVVKSCTSLQQGDPLAPLWFALAIDQCIRPISSEINIWYLDDGVLGGTPETIATELNTLRGKLLDIGLQINTAKCEVTFLGKRGSQQHRDALTHVRQFLPDLKEVDPNELTLLGSPLSEGGLESAIETAKNDINILCQRILSLDAHTAMFFLTNYVSAPQLTYLLRSAPVFKRKQKLSEIDDLLRAILSQTVNVHMRDDMWEQATLPTRHGGLGIRRLTDLAIPCFISSVKSCASLMSQITPPSQEAEGLSLVDEAVESFKSETSCQEVPEDNAALRQKKTGQNLLHGPVETE